MCPACITTAALALAGAASTGGLIALVLPRLPARGGASGAGRAAGRMERDERPGDTAAPRGEENRP